MPNVEGNGTHGSDKEGRTGVLGFSCQDWDRPVGWVLIDWEDTRQMRSLSSKNRRWGLTPGPELSQSQRGHDRVGDFQDDLASCPHHLGGSQSPGAAGW